jgi:hypothetical protein
VELGNLKELEKEVEECRRIAPQSLVDVFIILRERVRIAVLTPEGLDADIVALCAPFDESEGHR